MRLWRYIPVLLLLFAAPVGARAQVEIVHPSYLSFEDGKGSSAEHYKTGSRSLKWSWCGRRQSLSLKVDVGYLPGNPNPEETSVSSFVFWVYSPQPLEGSLRFEFLKGGKVCCSFPYKLGFTGWRGAWVAFDRDMEGTPETGMDQIRIVPVGARRGTLFFDGIIPAVFEDVRYHTADFQAPFINPETRIHWLLLNRHWNRNLDIPVGERVTEREVAELETVRNRFVDLISGGGKGYALKKAREVYGSYGIRYNTDGTVTGKPVFFTRYGETYINLGIRDASARFAAEGQLLRAYNDNLYRIALGWKREKDPYAKEEFERIYVDMTRHLLDQGFAAGSAQGTLHHLGYSMRNFYTGPVIMKDVLRKAGLLEQVQAACEWFSGLGEVKTAPETPGMDIDAFNTYLLSRVASVLLMDDGPRAHAMMKALSRWVDNGFRYTGGTKACFKTDGTVFHHRRAYPAYAVGGFDGAVRAVWLLHGTSFAISAESHGILRKALLEMRFYCNPANFPLAMSGRHPDGKGTLVPWHYSMMADSGTPDGKCSVDSVMLAAHRRLSGAPGAEPAPQGVRVYGYNCSLSARSGEWLVTIAGHSRYLWSAEIYRGANHYGRYLTHGSMEILPPSGPTYTVDGYDWCHIPGTTAAPLPMESMKAHVINPDEYSGYEEMLLSDEWFAGGVSHGNSGAYAMKLHENPKYNGSLRARKSYFVFGPVTVCLGSDIESDIPVHTTLFQNALPELSKADSLSGRTVLEDRFGNRWTVFDGETVYTRRLQRSLHEETDAPTSNWYEKAYIRQDRPTYEYMVELSPEGTPMSGKPYRLLSRTSRLHAVEHCGTVGAAVFEDGPVSDLIKYSTPCMLMYSGNGNKLEISVSNPDLALYRGPADEVFTSDGKYVERSIYSRKWVNNDCGEVSVELLLEGLWKTVSVPEGTIVREEGDSTRLIVPTSEGRTEKLVMTEKDEI